MAISKTGTITVGIVGAGLIGQAHSWMLHAVNEHSDTEVRVAAVSDTDLAKAKSLAAHWKGARVGIAADEVVSDREIEAVWICTPTRSHRDLVLAAARAGKHVFVEKPLAMSVEEAREMRSALDGAGVKSQVGLVLRFSPVYTVIRQLMASDGAGRVMAVTLRDDQDFPIRGARRSGWRNDPSKTPGGTLIEHGVHDFDLLAWLCGEVKSISCRTRNLNGAPAIEDFGAVTIEFRTGLYAQLVSIWHKILQRPSNRRLEVFTENLFVATDYDVRGSIVVQRGDDAEYVISENDVMRRFTEIVEEEKPWLAPLSDWSAIPYALEDLNFIQALRGRCEPEPSIGAGVYAQTLVEAAYESARADGRAIQVTSQATEFAAQHLNAASVGQ